MLLIGEGDGLSRVAVCAALVGAVALGTLAFPGVPRSSTTGPSPSFSDMRGAQPPLSARGGSIIGCSER